MALAAPNGYTSFFPLMVFLFCVFHLDSALRKTLLKMKNPGMDPDAFSRFKGQLVHEVHELVCGEKGQPPISEAEFDKRARVVSNLLWKRGMTTEAARWDYYVKIKSKWAPWARWEACKGFFGDAVGANLPMLARSNNVLESFFANLKRFLLRGVSAFTLLAMVQTWVSFQNRILINMLNANIDPRSVLRGTGKAEQEEDSDIEMDSDIESDQGEDDIDDVESEEEEEDLGALYGVLERDEKKEQERRDERFYSQAQKTCDMLVELLAK
jgi:hypothetical protein